VVLRGRYGIGWMIVAWAALTVTVVLVVAVTFWIFGTLRD
jgi:hypothetical protein